MNSSKEKDFSFGFESNGFTVFYERTCNDDSFGPVSDCRFFDFTVTFQNFILLISSGLFLLFGFFQLILLIKQTNLKGCKGKKFIWSHQIDKIGLIIFTLSIFQILISTIVLGISKNDKSIRNEISSTTALPAYTLNFLASLLQFILSMISRQQTQKGTAISIIYNFSTLFTDASRVRTYSNIATIQNSSFYRLCIINVIIKGLFFFLENIATSKDANLSPESRAGFVSSITFWWLAKLIWKGFRRPLDMVNLESLGLEYDSEAVGKRLQMKWDEQILKAVHRIDEKVKDDDQSLEKENISSINHDKIEKITSESKTILLKSCFLAFPFSIMILIIPSLLDIGVQMSMPYLINETVNFVESQSNKNNSKPSIYGWGLVGAYIFTNLISSFSSAQFQWLGNKASIRLRGALIDMIYRKSLRIHLSIANELGSGLISNLMSVDVERASKVIIPFHYLWRGILQSIITVYLLYRQIGLSVLATVFSIILCLAIPTFISKDVGPRQAKWSSSTDDRINLVSTAVNNAKNVKYMAYEKFIAEKLLEAREIEIKHGWSSMFLDVTIGILTSSIKEITAVITFTTLFLVDYFTGSNRFTISNIITSLTLLSLLELPLLMFGQQFALVLSALVSLKRIQTFFGKRERPILNMDFDHSQGSEGEINENAKSESSKIEQSIRLKNIESSIDSNIAASFENVSLGWSPKGKTVLKDLTLSIPFNKLTMICGPIGSGKTTLIQAILGEVDIQKGKIHLPILRESIAYVAQDGWLQENATIRDNITLQMPFDSELYQTVIYASALHIDLLQLEKNDDTLAKSLSGGQRQRLTLARALYTEAESYFLDDFTSALDAITASHVWNSLMGPTGLLRNKTVIFISNSLQFLKKASMVIRLENGKIVEMGRLQDLSEDAIEVLSRTSIDEQERMDMNAKRETFKMLENMQRKDVQHEKVEKGKISLSIYKQYILAAGIFAFISVFIFGIGFQNALKSSWIIYLQYFARVRNTFFTEKNNNQWVWLIGFFLLIFFSFAIPFIVDTLSSAICFIRVGKRLHKAEVKGVWNTGLKFFEQNPPGMIINRFSQDIFILDWDLTIALQHLLNCLFTLLVQVLLLIIPVPILIIVIVLVSFIYTGIQKLYSPVSRQLRRLEMATKSPLYSLISETSQSSGLATIRALKRQNMFIENNLGRLNRSQLPFFYLQAVRRWLLTSLNLLAMIVNVSLVILVVLLKNTKNVAILGAGLVNASQMAFQLNYALIGYTEVEIASVAIERITNFAALEPEEKLLENGKMRETLKPEDVNGKIELRNLTVTYPETSKPALRNINLTIKPGERIGICGRTGSGKSTLLLALFRMLEPSEGEIYLDDLNVQQFSAFSLRNSLTIVPQNPFILSMTIRENLDPLKEQDDLTIWDALKTCHLSEIIQDCSDGLNTKLDANFNLSAGQRQLFNLTRALLRKRNILVLDEATSSMDYETDLNIQNLLRSSKFKHCTIITVAHRIATIRDYDRVLVLDNGELIELDSPNKLMEDPKSVFRALALEQNVE